MAIIEGRDFKYAIVARDEKGRIVHVVGFPDPPIEKDIAEVQRLMVTDPDLSRFGTDFTISGVIDFDEATKLAERDRKGEPPTSIIVK